MIEFTKEELEVIKEALGQMILDGHAGEDDDPLVKAFVKLGGEV